MTLLILIAGLAAMTYAEQEPHKRTYTNPTDGSVLVWIPGGEFHMGSMEGDEDERPVTRIRVEGFWLGEKEVTNRQYAQFMAATGHKAPPFWEDPSYNHPDQPVVGLRYLDVVAYCQWAGVRVPTEAEWEYAAAVGLKQFKYGTATGELTHDLANFAGVGGRDTFDDVPAPVGSFPPNPFGLYDMAGNAWEWTSSLWKPYPYKADDGREDKTARGYRVMRGGCWHFGPYQCRVAYRQRHRDHLFYDYSGLRVALTTTPEIEAAAKVQAAVMSARPVASEDPLEAVVAALRVLYGRLGDLKLSEEDRKKGIAALNQLVRILKQSGYNW